MVKNNNVNVPPGPGEEDVLVAHVDSNISPELELASAAMSASVANPDGSLMHDLPPAPIDLQSVADAAKAAESRPPEKRSKRGRPKIEMDEDKIKERRREQIRLAQRSYRKKRDETYAELKRRVNETDNSLQEITFRTVSLLNKLAGLAAMPEPCNAAVTQLLSDEGRSIAELLDIVVTAKEVPSGSTGEDSGLKAGEPTKNGNIISDIRSKASIDPSLSTAMGNAVSVISFSTNNDPKNRFKRRRVDELGHEVSNQTPIIFDSIRMLPQQYDNLSKMVGGFFSVKQDDPEYFNEEDTPELLEALHTQAIETLSNLKPVEVLKRSTGEGFALRFAKFTCMRALRVYAKGEYTRFRNIFKQMKNINPAVKALIAILTEKVQLRDSDFSAGGLVSTMTIEPLDGVADTVRGHVEGDLSADNTVVKTTNPNEFSVKKVGDLVVYCSGKYIENLMRSDPSSMYDEEILLYMLSPGVAYVANQPRVEKDVVDFSLKMSRLN